MKKREAANWMNSINIIHPTVIEKHKSSNLLIPSGMFPDQQHYSTFKTSEPSKIKLVYNRDDESNGSNQSQNDINNKHK